MRLRCAYGAGMKSIKKPQKWGIAGILTVAVAFVLFWFVGADESAHRGPSPESESAETERDEPKTAEMSRTAVAVDTKIQSNRKAELPEGAPSDHSDAGQTAAPGTIVNGSADVAKPNGDGETDRLDRWFDELQAFPLVNELLEQGVTREDFERARQRMLAAGFSEAHTLDLNQLLAVLPRRNVRAVMIDDIELPARGLAGQEVTFTVRGTFPDASYAFDRWDITRTGDQVDVVPIGRTSGEQVPALIVPIEKEGRLPGMEAGRYAVHFKGLGAEASRTLIIE